MKTILRICCVPFCVVTWHVSAEVRYVDLNSPAPVAPYTSWVTAATNIQDALDACISGDTVIAADGVYASGVRYSTRVVIPGGVVLQSLNGPAKAVIRGEQAPGGRPGPEAVRCVSMQLSSVLSGFTITNGGTVAGPEVFQACGGGVTGDSTCLVTNCVITGNVAGHLGGGAFNVKLVSCRISKNRASNSGGGLSRCTAYYCEISENSSYYGGGAHEGSLHACAVTRNDAMWGGGALESFCAYCTFVGNQADLGGGTYQAGCRNCIIYYNQARRFGDNYYGAGGLVNTCTDPMPTNSAWNLAVDPELASASHISETSPCRGLAASYPAPQSDIDLESWFSPGSIGCDEYHPGAVTGALEVAISAPYTNLAVGFGADFVALIGGRVSKSTWSFGDGVVLTNRPFARHAWFASGEYLVTLTAYNETYPEGVSATLAVRVQEPPVHYVAIGSAYPVPPYLSAETAAPDIQSAVDAASVAGAVVLVEAGTYETGGRALVGNMTNRVVVDKPVHVKSLHGPSATIIKGFQVAVATNGPTAVRCLWLGQRAMVTGFTLTQGATTASIKYGEGGGAWCQSVESVLNSCILVGNAAYARGGGTFGGTLNNCVLALNRVGQGSAADSASLYNCTVVRNAGPALYAGWARNCIVQFNGTATGQNYGYTLMDYCCTQPMPKAGVGNFTNEPVFVELAALDLRVQPTSPTINAGRNGFAPGLADLDGSARIAGGTVDMGAYELPSPASRISYQWLQRYGLAQDGSADETDPDGDGMRNWQEWVAWTDPTNALSAVRMLSPLASTGSLTVVWESNTNSAYAIERATGSANVVFGCIASNIIGQAGTTSRVDTNVPSGNPVLYRVRVEPR